MDKLSDGDYLKSNESALAEDFITAYKVAASQPASQPTCPRQEVPWHAGQRARTAC